MGQCSSSLRGRSTVQRGAIATHPLPSSRNSPHEDNHLSNNTSVQSDRGVASTQPHPVNTSLIQNDPSNPPNHRTHSTLPQPNSESPTPRVHCNGPHLPSSHSSRLAHAQHAFDQLQPPLIILSSPHHSNFNASSNPQYLYEIESGLAESEGLDISLSLRSSFHRLSTHTGIGNHPVPHAINQQQHGTIQSNFGFDCYPFSPHQSVLGAIQLNKLHHSASYNAPSWYSTELQGDAEYNLNSFIPPIIAGKPIDFSGHFSPQSLQVAVQLQTGNVLIPDDENSLDNNLHSSTSRPILFPSQSGASCDIAPVIQRQSLPKNHHSFGKLDLAMTNSPHNSQISLNQHINTPPIETSPLSISPLKNRRSSPLTPSDPQKRTDFFRDDVNLSAVAVVDNTKPQPPMFDSTEHRKELDNRRSLVVQDPLLSHQTLSQRVPSSPTADQSPPQSVDNNTRNAMTCAIVLPTTLQSSPTRPPDIEVLQLRQTKSSSSWHTHNGTSNSFLLNTANSSDGNYDVLNGSHNINSSTTSNGLNNSHSNHYS